MVVFLSRLILLVIWFCSNGMVLDPLSISWIFLSLSSDFSSEVNLISKTLISLSNFSASVNFFALIALSISSFLLEMF